MGKIFFKFLIKLAGQGFIMRNHQSGFLGVGNDIGHRVSFTTAGDAQQNLVDFSFLNSGSQLINGLLLVSGRGIVGG